MRCCSIFILLGFILVFGGCDSPTKNTTPITHEYLTGGRGFKYQLIKWNNLEAQITTQRPERENKEIHFCIPLTPPDSTEAMFRHYYCFDGEQADSSRFNPKLLGALAVQSGKISLHFDRGDINSSDLPELCNRGANLVQLIAAIDNGEILLTDNRKKFQCRAIVEFEDGSIGMIETLKHNTKILFARDLKSFGVKNAVMTATGPLDEGWYYYGGVPVALGRLRSLSQLQENWLVLKKP